MENTRASQVLSACEKSGLTPSKWSGNDFGAPSLSTVLSGSGLRLVKHVQEYCNTQACQEMD